MEWKTLRKWLLLMLLAVDLFLAGNLALQVLDDRQSERQALADAVDIAAGRDIFLDQEALLRLPVSPVTYSGQRSAAQEQAAADALLGSGIRPEALGGGVSSYRGDLGQLSFRRGGQLELDLIWQGPAPDGAACVQLLTAAGFQVEDALQQQEGAMTVFTQRQEGAPIVNNRLTIALQDDVLQVRGRWLLAKELTAQTSGMSRAQLALALADLLEEQQLTRPDGVEYGYFLQSEDTRSMTLVPVWIVTAGDTQTLLSCVSGQVVLF